MTVRAQRFAIQAVVLQKHSAETEVLLRICGIANALTAIGRLFGFASDTDPDSAMGLRDRNCAWIIVASYLKEAVPLLNKRHDGLAWKLAKAGLLEGVTFPPEMSLESLETVMNKDSPFITACGSIRDKFAFHMDNEPFMSWVAFRLPTEGVGIISQLGPLNQDFVYDASTFAIHEATEKLMNDGFGERVANVCLAMPYLVEAMARGFAKLKGLTLSLEKNAVEDIVLAHEPGAFSVLKMT